MITLYFFPCLYSSETLMYPLNRSTEVNIIITTTTNIRAIHSTLLVNNRYITGQIRSHYSFYPVKNIRISYTSCEIY